MVEARRTGPVLRKRLHELVDDLVECRDQRRRREMAIEAHGCLEEGKKRFARRRAKARLAKLTPEKAAEIRADAAAHPEDPFRAIARRCQTDIGRVSEAISGFRDGTTL